MLPERCELKDRELVSVRTAPDDFGNGYSGLTTVTSSPMQLIKIDRSFTVGLGQDLPGAEGELEVVRGIVNAHGLPTIAGGGETATQAVLLTKAGCAYHQIHFSRHPEPLPWTSGLPQHGIQVSHETQRKWCLKFGPLLADVSRPRKPRRGSRWLPDEV